MKKQIAGFATGFLVVTGILIACTTQMESSPIPSLTSPIPAAAESLTPTPDEIAGKFDIGGRSLYLRCVGAGTPTVILETGWTGPGYHWSDVMNQARQITRLCAYDRAGLGQSDPAPPPRTSRDMVADLHALLDVAKIQGPYILVGQSFGGFIIRLYANQYPEEIVGIVLVDSTHPDQDSAYSAALPPESPDESSCVNQFR